MKILFSPSEAKNISPNEYPPFNKDSFIFKDLFPQRLEMINAYSRFIQSASEEQLSILFGVKDKKLIDEYKKPLYEQRTMKTVQRYSGVAFEYLNYNSLPLKAQDFIDSNTIIFSNLFGPLMANDHLPNYKLKQGESINGIKQELFYKKHFSSYLDSFLKDDFILDLRAGYYNKFYNLPYPHTTIKFKKDGKVVSHWAKAYRGILLREVSTNNISTIDEFMNMKIKDLSIKEIKEYKLKSEITYDIDMLH